MKNFIVFIGVLVMAILLSSCAAIGAIFKAGIWVGAIIVIGIILLIIYLASRSSKK